MHIFASVVLALPGPPASPVVHAACASLQINLSKKDKLCEPAYQELKAKDIPHVDKDGVHAIVIAGEVGHGSCVGVASVRM